MWQMPRLFSLDFHLFRYDGYTYIGEWHPLPQLPKHLPPLPPLPRPFGTSLSNNVYGRRYNWPTRDDEMDLNFQSLVHAFTQLAPFWI